VLAQRTSLESKPQGNAIKQAFQTSGLFLESHWRPDRFHHPQRRRIFKAALIVRAGADDLARA